MPGRHSGALVGAAILALFIVAASAAAAWPRPWLVVCDGDGLRYAFAAAGGTQFSLAWQHSVEHEDWIETFAVRDDAIVLTSTRFKTFGAGVPSHAGTRTTLDHGWVVMEGIDRVVDPLAVQAAAAERYRMRRGDHWFALSAAGSAPILNFAVIKAPLIRVIGGVMHAWRAPAAGMP